MEHTIICGRRPGQGWYVYHHQYGDFMAPGPSMQAQEHFFCYEKSAKETLLDWIGTYSPRGLHVHYPTAILHGRDEWLMRSINRWGRAFYLNRYGEMTADVDDECYWKDPDAGEEMLYQRAVGLLTPKRDRRPTWLRNFSSSTHSSSDIVVDGEMQWQIARYVHRQHHAVETLTEALKKVRRETLCQHTRGIVTEVLNEL